MSKMERRQARRASPAGPLKGHLDLTGAGQNQTVFAVQNVSPYGLCVLVEYAVGEGESVELTYREGFNCLELSGTTVWCTKDGADPHYPEKGPKYQVGIALNQTDMKANTLFFRACTDPE